MLAILNSLNAHNLPIFQPTLLILVSKFMIHRILSDKTYLLLGLLSCIRFKSDFYSNSFNSCLSLSLYDYEPQLVVTDTTQRMR